MKTARKAKQTSSMAMAGTDGARSFVVLTGLSGSGKSQAIHALEENREGIAVENVFARVHFVAAVLAVVLEHVEDRTPALRELVERGLDQTGRTLRPRI